MDRAAARGRTSQGVTAVTGRLFGDDEWVGRVGEAALLDRPVGGSLRSSLIAFADRTVKRRNATTASSTVVLLRVYYSNRW